MNKYTVRLAQVQRQALQHLITTGTESARRLLHARILLKADAGKQGPAGEDKLLGRRPQEPQ